LVLTLYDKWVVAEDYGFGKSGVPKQSNKKATIVLDNFPTMQGAGIVNDECRGRLQYKGEGRR
jgi:hypothetical protein